MHLKVAATAATTDTLSHEGHRIGPGSYSDSTARLRPSFARNPAQSLRPETLCSCKASCKNRHAIQQTRTRVNATRKFDWRTVIAFWPKILSPFQVPLAEPSTGCTISFNHELRLKSLAPGSAALNLRLQDVCRTEAQKPYTELSVASKRRFR